MWYLFKAKTFQPLTLDKLALTWKLHKQQAKCNALQIRCLLTKHGEVVGFQCECGYKFLQKRLLSQKVHYTKTNLTSLMSHKTMIRQKADVYSEELDPFHVCIKEI